MAEYNIAFNPNSAAAQNLQKWCQESHTKIQSIPPEELRAAMTTAISKTQQAYDEHRQKRENQNLDNIDNIDNIDKLFTS